MILILIFAEALALYGLIVGIILSSRAGQSRAEWKKWRLIVIIIMSHMRSFMWCVASPFSSFSWVWVLLLLDTLV